MVELKKFEKNIQSQFGEDGVIEEIFNRIGTSNKICVEFGAWDGIHLSNAWNLWNNRDWNALLIEGDSVKYQLLVSNTAAYENVHPYLAYVTPDGQNCLDKILKKVNYPEDIDMLSVDIDGDDYYILETLDIYKPRLIIIEFNPSIPPHLEIVQKRNEYFGCSALSLLNLAHRKGYKLAHLTVTNLFLVKEDLFYKLGFAEPTLSELFIYEHLTYHISGYDGKSFLVGKPPFLTLNPIPESFIFPEIISVQRNIHKVIINQTVCQKMPEVKKSLARRILNKIFK